MASGLRASCTSACGVAVANAPGCTPPRRLGQANARRVIAGVACRSGGADFDPCRADGEDHAHVSVLYLRRPAAVALLEALVERARWICLDVLDNPAKLDIAVLVLRIDD